MFRISIQDRDRKGDYTTVKSITVEQFNEELAVKANTVAKTKGLFVQMYLDHSDPVPEGYSSKRLEYSTVIWKSVILDTQSALSALDAL